MTKESMIEKTVRVSLVKTADREGYAKKISIDGLAEGEARLYQKMAEHLAYTGVSRGETDVEIKIVLKRPKEKKD